MEIDFIAKIKDQHTSIKKVSDKLARLNKQWNELAKDCDSGWIGLKGRICCGHKNAIRPPYCSPDTCALTKSK